MSLFYTASHKEILEIRNKIFVESGIPALNKNGFTKSPFSTATFGKHPDIGYAYELCRLSGSGCLEIVVVYIVRGDRWIQIHLNIFKLASSVESLDQLNGVNGLQYYLPPNSNTNMRLGSGDIKGPPLFRLKYWLGHKLARFYTKGGLTRSIKHLANNIETDLRNIDYFIKRWHELHKPMVTTREGKIEGLDGMTVNERLFASGLMNDFAVAQKKDKERAKQILRWLKVDELSIGEIIKETSR